MVGVKHVSWEDFNGGMGFIKVAYFVRRSQGIQCT